MDGRNDAGAVKGRCSIVFSLMGFHLFYACFSSLSLLDSYSVEVMLTIVMFFYAALTRAAGSSALQHLCWLFHRKSATNW